MGSREDSNDGFHRQLGGPRVRQVRQTEGRKREIKREGADPYLDPPSTRLHTHRSVQPAG